MGGDAYIQPGNDGRRYEAVLRLSEALSVCTEPEDLTKILSEQLHEFLDFLQLNGDHRGRRIPRRNRSTFMTGTPMQEYRHASNKELLLTGSTSVRSFLFL
jgi:hypothetical protein